MILSESLTALRHVQAVLADFDGLGGAMDRCPSRVTLRAWSRPEAVRLPRGAPTAEQDGIRAWEAGSSVWLACDGHRAHADLAAGVADLAIPRSGVRKDFVMNVLLLLLRRRGLVGVHASAVARGGSGVLFVGPCGSGKSTQTYALVRRGWQYLADDALLLRARAPGTVEALALRRDLLLDDAALGMFGRGVASTLPRAANGKRRLAEGGADAAQLIDSTVPRTIVFPCVTGDARSRLVEIDRAEALRHLFAQTIMLWLDRETLPEALALLGGLVRQSRCFRLFAGGDLKAHPEAIGDLLADVVSPDAAEAAA